MAARPKTIVEYHGEHGRHRCGYCGSSDGNYSHGMWAHQMTCEDYQDLIDRGWRRSGKYCYKPSMSKMCCPSYTITCEALKFKSTKSQKKVLKKMTKYLTVPITEPSTVSVEEAGSSCNETPGGAIPSDYNEAGHDRCLSNIKSRDVKDVSGAVNNDQIREKKKAKGIEAIETGSKSDTSNMMSSLDGKSGDGGGKEKNKTSSEGADPNKPPCRKAKVTRRERKLQKLAARGIEIEARGPPASQESFAKSIEELLVENLPDKPTVHKLEVKLVRSDPSLPEFKSTFAASAKVFFKYQKAIHKDPPEKCTEKRVKLVRVDRTSAEFQSTFKQSHKLFEKYQMAIHKDEPDECTELQYKRFLVDSPLMHSTGRGAPPVGYGSFHQQYYLDGKLIAVGVLDILPRCVSSVYLYYDPDYSFISPGVYSALREIHLTRQLHSQAPGIVYYYMGFYLHSCPKMNYKGNYFPSYLVCPETYSWVPIEQCRPKLDVNKYSRLDENSQVPPSTDINSVLILHKRQAMPYQVYVVISGDDDEEEVQQFADLVGPVVASRMLLFRS